MNIETIKVHNPSGDGFMVINKSDFNDDKFRLWEDSPNYDESTTSIHNDIFHVQPKIDQPAPIKPKMGRPFKQR